MWILLHSAPVATGLDQQVVPVDWKLSTSDVMENSMAVSPNPFTNSFQLDYEASASESITVDVFTVNGQRVFSQKMNVEKGTNSLRIDGDKIPTGLLIVSLQNGEEVMTQRLVKQ